MPEDDFWECYPKGRGTECRRRRRQDYTAIGNQGEKDVYFSNTNYRIKARDDFDVKKEYASYDLYSYDRHFSTHDWLAYIPLKIILENDHFKWKWNGLVDGEFWTEDFIRLFLYATAAPDYWEYYDYKNIKLRPWPDYVRFNPTGNIIDDVEYIVKSPRTPIKGVKTMYFRKRITNYKNPIIGCNEVLRQINGDLREKEYDKSVFRLGLITHYIADCGCFPHLVDYMNNLDFLDKISIHKKNRYNRNELRKIYESWSVIHNHFQNMIGERTDGRKGCLVNPLKITINTRKDLNLWDYFNLNVDKIISKTKSKHPASAASDTAIFTYTDLLREKTADYMFLNYLDVLPTDWKLIPSDIFEKEPESKQEYFMKLFLEKIHMTLEETVYNILCAFEYIINQNI